MKAVPANRGSPICTTAATRRTPHPASDTPTSDPPETRRAGTAPEINPHEDTPGHPKARGTLPMARYLTDPDIEDEIQALAAEVPPMTVDQAIRLARLLRFHKRSPDRAA